MRYFQILSCAVLLGCAGSGIGLAPGRTPPSGESIVFGSVEVVGELIGDVPLIAANNTEISVWDRARHKEIAVDEIGEFVWHFPPGEYAIMHYRESRAMSLIVATQTKSEELRIAAEFEVPSEPGVFYVGTLVVTVHDDDRVTKRVEDRYDAAAAAFREEYLGAGGEITKRLLVFEERRG